jgi:cholesterol oxidase
VGCNEQAKNTLDLNYLAVAERNGADVGTRCEVTGIAAAGDGYEVRFRDHAAGRAEVVRARTVVLAAGAVRSTELLLRCRDELGTLPRLSPALGTRYSGNGDFLAFAMDTSDDFDPHVGPVITSAMLYDRGTGPDRQWFLFQEGGFPRQVAKLVRLLDDRLLDAVRGLPRAPDDVLAGIRRAARGVDLDPADEDRRMGVFLVMGRDSGTGRIELARGSGELRVKWDLSANLALYETQQRFCADVAHALGGRLALNPMWQWLRLPVSVHNLGGCAMADDPAKGVTDGFGQAHGHPGLYVLDGGSLPSPTGVNPAHTIAAVAERNIEAAIRAITGVAGWSAPERRGAAAVDDPLARVVVPPGGTPAPSTPGVGLVYREYLSGRIDGVTGAVRAELEVAAPSVVEMLADDAHRLVVSGRLWVPGFTGPPGARIGNGMVNLLVPGERPGARRVLYALPFFGPDGSHYLLDARKELPENGRLDLWDDATTIRFTIRRGHVAEGDPLAGGSLRQSVSSLVRQLVSTRVTGTGSPLRKSEALVRHGRFLGGALASAYLTAGLGRTTT